MTVPPRGEMDPIWRPATWEQLVASVDMLRNAMNACPDDLWDDREQKPEFWYLVFHTLFWLDLYLSPSVEGFTPPAPFTLDELDENGLMPKRPYSKSELSTYFDHCRAKCASVIGSMSDERAQQRCGFPWLECTVGEMHAYNMRHVQHGVGHSILFSGKGLVPRHHGGSPGRARVLPSRLRLSRRKPDQKKVRPHPLRAPWSVPCVGA